MNTTLRVRHLDRESDFPKLIEFLRSRSKQMSLPDYWTIGSKMCFYLNLFESSESNHHLWEDQSGDIHAYTKVIPSKRSWTIQIHPDYCDEQHILRMIDEAESFIDSHPEAEAKSIQYQTKVYESDALLLSLLQARGYEQGKYDSPYFRQSLESKLSPVAMHSEFTIREFRGGAEIEQRAGAQRDSFTGNAEADPWSIRNIERMIDYRKSNDDIDLIAINSEGVIGSYAVCQIDQVTKIGEFDPLGTRTRYRRRGLATAVINGGLRAMRGKGMEIAVVRTQRRRTGRETLRIGRI